MTPTGPKAGGRFSFSLAESVTSEPFLPKIASVLIILDLGLTRSGPIMSHSVCSRPSAQSDIRHRKRPQTMISRGLVDS